jgi:heme/copper-type cytochrome/quinol oxidase subunit 3
MAEMTAAGSGLSREQEEAAFYHEAALNSVWTGSRLAIGIVASGLGAFVFSFFYLRSVNSYGLWYPKGFTGPKTWQGTVIMGLIVLSAVAQSAGLQQIKAGKRAGWIAIAWLSLVLGLASVAVLCWQLGSLPFQPGDNGFASVFVGATPVFGALVVAAMIWLEILVMRARRIPDVSFIEQPPTFAEAAEVQQLQASLSAFTLMWNFLAAAAIVLWLLFYIVH